MADKRVAISLSLSDLLKLGATVVCVAGWLILLEYRVHQLETHETYYHGTLEKGPVR